MPPAAPPSVAASARASPLPPPPLPPAPAVAPPPLPAGPPLPPVAPPLPPLPPMPLLPAAPPVPPPVPPRPAEPPVPPPPAPPAPSLPAGAWQPATSKRLLRINRFARCSRCMLRYISGRHARDSVTRSSPSSTLRKQSAVHCADEPGPLGLCAGARRRLRDAGKALHAHRLRVGVPGELPARRWQLGSRPVSESRSPPTAPVGPARSPSRSRPVASRRPAASGSGAGSSGSPVARCPATSTRSPASRFPCRRPPRSTSSFVAMAARWPPAASRRLTPRRSPTAPGASPPVARPRLPRWPCNPDPDEVQR